MSLPSSTTRTNCTPSGAHAPASPSTTAFASPTPAVLRSRHEHGTNLRPGREPGRDPVRPGIAARSLAALPAFGARAVSPAQLLPAIGQINHGGGAGLAPGTCQAG